MISPPKNIIWNILENVKLIVQNKDENVRWNKQNSGEAKDQSGR